MMEIQGGLLQENHDMNLSNDFVVLAEQTVQYAKMANCQLRALSAPNFPYFNHLTIKNQGEVLRSLKTFNEICEDTLANGDSLAESNPFVWQALKKLGLRFPSDLFNYIKKENIIEIYDLNNIQIFRNFNFFDVTSYSLEDLLCRPWVELFQRANHAHTKALTEGAQKFYSREVTTMISFAHLGVQSIRETDSAFGFEVDAVVDYLAPIYDCHWRPAGFMAIETGDLAHPAPTGLQAERLLEKHYQKQS